MLCKISMERYYWILIYQNWPIDIYTIDIIQFGGVNWLWRVSHPGDLSQSEMEKNV